MLACLTLLAGPSRAANFETLSWDAAAGFKTAAALPAGALRPLPRPPVAGFAVPARGVSPRFSPGGGVDAEILSRLEGVDRSVDIAMYSFSHASLVARVKALAKAGRKVRLILNAANKSADAAKAFEDAGVDVRYVTPIMHHKFAILDGPQASGDNPAQALLLTGSGNWSMSSARSYDEDFLAFEGAPDLVRSFQAEFNFLWSRSRDIPGPTRHGDTAEISAPAGAPVVFTSANMEARRTPSGWTFSPRVAAEQGVAGRSIVSAMDGAKERIRIASAHFRRKDFYAALGRALGRGVRVEMLLDQQEYSGPAAKNPADPEHLDEILGRTGADVRYKTYSRVWKHQTAKQMHAKYMIVDDRLVLTGSFNWSDNAEIQTMENLLRLEGPEVAGYVEHHPRVFAYGRGSLDPLLERVRGQKGRGPCDFEPVSLSAAEMRRLRAAYSFDACR